MSLGIGPKQPSRELLYTALLLTAVQRNAEKTCLDIGVFIGPGPTAFKISSAPSTCAK
jgi:hypothetical protein